MKKFMCALLVFATVGVLFAVAADSSKKLRHVVALKFKEDAKPEDIQKVESAFRALKTTIPKIASLEWGTNVSKENLNKGFTHCFFLTFATDQDLQDYIVHPQHKAFVEILKPTMSDAFVIDYWAKE